MTLPESYEPEFESLMELLVEMPRERSLDRLLDLIVRRFTRRPHLALARIWLLLPGDRCDDCERSSGCFDSTACLHLVAGDGNCSTGSEVARSLRGPDARIPLGSGIIGKVASTGSSRRFPGEPELPEDLPGLELMEPGEVKSFSCLPLVYRGDVLGVIAVYLKIPFPVVSESKSWLRIVADQAAAAISNARAFDEIDRLRRRLEQENAYLREEVRQASDFDRLIGDGEAMCRLRGQMEIVAPTEATVLVMGETGTGKELVAREIHRLSLRRDKPMIKVNCAAIVPDLWESEFFGHVKGAFTGALKDRSGRFELADEGTLFLDEVGEIPLELQSRLLRVLQEGSFERVGGEATRKVDVRIIAASNRDLDAEVGAGRFRRDLYYRLAVYPIEVPPLRDRGEDIPALTRHFVDMAARRMNKKKIEVEKDSLARLAEYGWPGNIRELRNVIERSIISGAGERLEIGTELLAGGGSGGVSVAGLGATGSEDQGVLTIGAIRRLEDENIDRALERSGGKIYGEDGAAALLGMKPTTLCSRLHRNGKGARRG
jgi:transcriptional regulator with GAF, ATPase, and Fis domain